MSVTVLYQGLELAQGVDVRLGELGLFLPLGAPMPVGTRLVLERPGVGQQPIRVNRVLEAGDASGVYIVAEGALVFPLIEEQPAAPSASASPAPPGPASGSSSEEAAATGERR
jgi:hypothetical protein